MMLEDLIECSRIMQLYAHAAHNLTSGPTFFQDHEFFGELYPEYESIYDSLVERSIGLFGAKSVNQVTIAQAAVDFLKKAPLNSADNMLAQILNLEKHLCSLAATVCESSNATEGVKQLVGGISDDSEVRQYKLKQRLS
jgi:DNA-binding ferritin-like protein